jgi:nucleoid-associated protein YgaU
VGLQLLTAPLAGASTLTSLNIERPAPGTAASAPRAVSAAWIPTAVPVRPAVPAGEPPAVPPGGASGTAAAHPQWRPLSPVVEPGQLAGRPFRLQQPAGADTEVTVRPGDSLWSLSAARLGPFASDVDIALDWPRLYQANRDVIGANPHFLRPGQVLRIPPGP